MLENQVDIRIFSSKALQSYKKYRKVVCFFNNNYSFSFKY